MLNPSEKAYCRALLALKNKDYRAAAAHFDGAAADFRDNQEFVLLRETNRLLLTVKKELVQNDDSTIEIEETFSNG